MEEHLFIVLQHNFEMTKMRNNLRKIALLSGTLIKWSKIVPGAFHMKKLLGSSIKD